MQSAITAITCGKNKKSIRRIRWIGIPNHKDSYTKDIKMKLFYVGTPG